MATGNMKKVLFVLPSLLIGGSEKMIAQLAEETAGAGHQATLVTLSSGSGREVTLPSGVELVRLDKTRSFMALPSLLRLIFKLRPDIVFSSIIHMNLLCGLLSLLFPKTSIKFIARETLIPFEEYQLSLHRLLYSAFCRFIYPRMYRVVFQSGFMKESFEAFIGRKLSNAEVINNFLDTIKIAEVSSVRGFHEPYFIAVGRLNQVKRFHLLIDVVEKLSKQARLLIIGEGSLHDDLQSLIRVRNLETQIRIISFRPDHLSYIKGAEALLISSHFEGFPNVALEALALGKPVIAYECPGGLREILDDQRLGTLVPSGDVANFASVLTGLKNGRFDAIQIIDETRRRYDRAVIMPKYFKVLFA